MAVRKKHRPKSKKQTIRRVNRKSLLILLTVVVLCVLTYFPLVYWSNQRIRQSAIDQVKALEKAGRLDEAIHQLDQSLALWPDSREALSLQGRLLAESARTTAQVFQAANINDRLLRLDSSGEHGQEIRRRLVRLYLRYDEAIREEAVHNADAEYEVLGSRRLAALTLARQIIANGARDSDAHRLLGLALDASITQGADNTLKEAIHEYLEAIRLDPGDFVSAEHLARLYLERTNEPAMAERTLDALLKSGPDSVPIRLSRHRHFKRAGLDARARVELEAALKLSDDDVALRITAADDALSRRDPESALRHLDAIPPKSQDDLLVRTLRGNVEYALEHPDEAFEHWSTGLRTSHGSDQTLTWQLAFTLIQAGRLGEAQPLVAQYRRLSGDDPRGMSRFLQAMLEQRSGHPARARLLLERIEDKLPAPWQAEHQLILGRCFEAMGDDSAALVAYRRASTSNPKASAPFREIARVLRTRQPDEALAELDKALKMAPDDPSLLVDKGRFLLDQQLARTENQRIWSDLEQLLERIGTDGRRGSKARLLRADFLAATGRLGEAVRLLEKSSQGVDRKDVETWVAWANGLELQGRRAEALRVLEQATLPGNVGDRASIRVAQARLLYRAGRGQAAREALARNQDRLNPLDSQKIAQSLGDLDRELGDYQGARTAYEDWARKSPESPAPGLALLALSQISGDDETARVGLEWLKRVGGDQESYGLSANIIALLREDPNRPVDILLKRGRLDEAQKLLEKLESIAPNRPLTHLIRGMVFESLDRPEPAIEAYRKASVDLSLSQVLPRMISLLARLKRYGEIAILKRDYLARVARSGLADTSAAFDKVAIEAALKAGDKDRAEILALEIVEASPDTLQDRTYLARLLLDLGKPDEAEATLRDLVVRQPENPDAWAALVMFEVLRGSTADASKTINQIRKGYKGERPEMLLARCHAIIGDQATAAGIYRQEQKKRPADLELLKVLAFFDESTGRYAELEAILGQILKVDPSARWASRMLAVRVASRPYASSWSEAWSLLGPLNADSIESPEDRLARSALLTRAPELARRLEAAPMLADLVRDLPTSHPVAIQARLRLTRAMLDGQRAAEASKLVEPMVDAESRPDASVLAVAVEAFARANKVDSAGRALERLEAVEPDSTRTILAQAWVFLARKKLGDAVRMIEAAQFKAEETPEGEAVGISSHDLLVKLEQFEASARVADRVASRWPRQSYLMARYQSSRGQVAEALESCRKSVEAGGSIDALKLAIGVAMDHSADPKWLKVVDDLASSSLAKSPEDPDQLAIVAKIRHYQGRCEEERAMDRQALARQPANPWFLNDMAWDLSEVFHEPQEALKLIDEAIRRDGRLPGYVDTQGVILDRLGRSTEAIAALEESARFEPSAVTHFHLARAYRKAGNNERFRHYRDLAKKAGLDPSKLDPSDRPEALEILKQP